MRTPNRQRANQQHGHVQPGFGHGGSPIQADTVAISIECTFEASGFDYLVVQVSRKGRMPASGCQATSR